MTLTDSFICSSPVLLWHVLSQACDGTTPSPMKSCDESSVKSLASQVKSSRATASSSLQPHPAVCAANERRPGAESRGKSIKSHCGPHDRMETACQMCMSNRSTASLLLEHCGLQTSAVGPKGLSKVARDTQGLMSLFVPICLLSCPVQW